MKNYFNILIFTSKILNISILILEGKNGFYNKCLLLSINN